MKIGIGCSCCRTREAVHHITLMNPEGTIGRLTFCGSCLLAMCIFIKSGMFVETAEKSLRDEPNSANFSVIELPDSSKAELN